MRVAILGVEFDALSMDDAVSRGAELLRRGGGYVVTPNPEIVQLCRRDERLRDAVNGAVLVLPDGVGVVYAARILGKPLRERVPGIDFAERLLGVCAERGYSVFLLGAKPGVADRAAERLRTRYPGLTIAGTRDGYFTDGAAIVERVNASGADVVFVCLGAPKQELWMVDNVGRLGAKLLVGLGGALDVFAGDVKRAPTAWRRLGLEWLYRLLREPQRIKRMIKLPLFLLLAVAARFGGAHAR